MTKAPTLDPVAPDNTQALQALINSGQPVVIPPGVYHFTRPAPAVIESKVYPCLMVDSPVVITGAGPEKTILQFAAAGPGYNWCALDTAGSLTIHGMTLEGDGSSVSAGVNHAGPNPIGMEVRLKDVTIRGFSNGVMLSTNAGTVPSTLKLIRCDISAGKVGVSSFGGATRGDQEILAQETYFRAITGSKGHLLYAHPHVSLGLYDCRFGKTPEYSIHHYSGGMDPGPAEEITIKGCVFEPGTGSVLTSDSSRTDLTACLFCSGGIQARSMVDVTECLFTGDSPGISGDTTARRVQAYLCTFLGRSMVVAAGDGADWEIAVCRFLPAGVAYAVGNSGNPVVTIRDCWFGSVFNPATGLPSFAIHPNQGAQYTLSGNQFCGDVGQTYIAPSSTATVTEGQSDD